MRHLIIFLFTLILSSADELNLKEFISGNRRFTSAVYKQLTQKNENFLFSPFSAEVALAVAQSGARNETGEEIRKGLSLPNNKGKVEDIFTFLVPRLKGRNKICTIISANKMYLRKNVAPRDDFLQTAAEVYQCPIENIDFSKKSKSVERINSWVEKRTKNKIHDLISEDCLNENTVAIFVNALYFKGEWQKMFKNHTVKKRNFFKSTKEAVKVDMMHNKEFFDYYESKELNAKFLKLRFKGSKTAQMIFVLPNETDGLAAIENQIEKVLVNPVFDKWQYVNLILPKFKIETSVDLKQILQNLGIEKAFSHDADFSGIAGEKGDISISEVLQKTFINVNEDGVEASAATRVQFQSRSFMDYIGEPKDFIVDHPFLFFIKVRHTIVFIGRVLSPSI